MTVTSRNCLNTLLALTLMATYSAPVFATGKTLSLMSFNTWGAGLNSGDSIAQTVAAIKAADADLVGLQETRAESVPCLSEVCPASGPSVAAAIAGALGYHVYQQTQANDALWANAILSRYPIISATANDLGVHIDVQGQVVYFFNIHLTDYPYQPYQLLNIEYGDAPFLDSAQAAVESARQARAPALALLKQDLAEADGARLTAITGDFNEPSRQDWNQATVAAGLQPMVVPWPFTSALEEMGFTDAYRAAFPDPAAKPGFTWTPLSTSESLEDHLDRIDFIFVRADSMSVGQAEVLGESEEMADIVVAPWPSDHRAVRATVTIDFAE